jgi:hypothetical protein
MAASSWPTTATASSSGSRRWTDASCGRHHDSPEHALRCLRRRHRSGYGPRPRVRWERRRRSVLRQLERPRHDGYRRRRGQRRQRRRDWLRWGLQRRRRRMHDGLRLLQRNLFRWVVRPPGGWVRRVLRRRLALLQRRRLLQRRVHRGHVRSLRRQWPALLRGRGLLLGRVPFKRFLSMTAPRRRDA